MGSCSDRFRRRLEALPARRMSAGACRGHWGVRCLRAGSVKENAERTARGAAAGCDGALRG